MKLVIQIPCFNEEQTLPQTIHDLPQSIPGIDQIEILVVDDGSTDRTVEVARLCGAHHVLSLDTNRGLGRAFAMGLEKAMSLHADIVVNTDGDNQYVGADIAKLVEPILRHQADMVVGCRPIADHPEFSLLKKLLQSLGSWTLRSLSKTSVRDAASGFRAFSREACGRLVIYSRFSYCMETLIQAGNSHLRVDSVDIRVNPITRKSRLFKSLPEYLWKSGCHHGDHVYPLPARPFLRPAVGGQSGQRGVPWLALYLPRLSRAEFGGGAPDLPSIAHPAGRAGDFWSRIGGPGHYCEFVAGKPPVDGGNILSTAATGRGTFQQRASILAK